MLQLSDIGDRLVKARLQSLPGVGQARIFGERRFSMRVWLSASELSARGLTVQDVQQAIRTRNVEVPAGRIESERREFTVRSLGELKTPEEFGNLVVNSRSGYKRIVVGAGHLAKELAGYEQLGGYDVVYLDEEGRDYVTPGCWKPPVPPCRSARSVRSG